MNPLDPRRTACPSRTQLQQYCVGAGRGYAVTATTPSTQYERFELEFRQLLDGLRLQ